jgi:hypothetical protein
MYNSSTERKQNQWPAFKISTGRGVHCRSQDVPGMRLCSGVWPCIFGNVLHQCAFTSSKVWGHRRGRVLMHTI